MTQLGELLNAQPELRAQEVLEQQLGQPTAIAHTDGDEKRPAFWRMLVNSDPQSLIAKETAILQFGLFCSSCKDSKHVERRSILPVIR
jgi:hypothetical protein